MRCQEIRAKILVFFIAKKSNWSQRFTKQKHESDDFNITPIVLNFRSVRNFGALYK